MLLSQMNINEQNYIKKFFARSGDEFAKMQKKYMLVACIGFAVAGIVTFIITLVSSSDEFDIIYFFLKLFGIGMLCLSIYFYFYYKKHVKDFYKEMDRYIYAGELYVLNGVIAEKPGNAVRDFRYEFGRYFVYTEDGCRYYLPSIMGYTNGFYDMTYVGKRCYIISYNGKFVVWGSIIIPAADGWWSFEKNIVGGTPHPDHGV